MRLRFSEDGSCHREYIIEAFGASGGSSSNSNRLGGKGAKIKGTFSLTEGTILKLVVGQEGTEGTYSGNKDYGGGGGTFHQRNPLITVLQLC